MPAKTPEAAQADPNLALNFDPNEVRDWFRLARRPFPRFRQIDEVLQTMAYEAAKRIDKRALYNRIESNPQTFSLASAEFQIAIELIFWGEGERPPLVQRPGVVERLVSQIQAGGAAWAVNSLLFQFFTAYPRTLENFKRIAAQMQKAAGLISEDVPPEAKVLPFFDDNAPEQLVSHHLIPASQTINAFLEKTKIARSDPTGGFALALWKARQGHYQRLIKEAAKLNCSPDRETREESQLRVVEDAIRLIKADSCVSTGAGGFAFRFVQGKNGRPSVSDDEALSFVNCITGPYSPQSDYLLKRSPGNSQKKNTTLDLRFPAAVLKVLSGFLVRLFPENSKIFPKASARVQALVKFWNCGRELVDALLFADAASNNQYQWYPRFTFWMDYWLANRIKSCKPLISRRRLHDVQIKFQNKQGRAYNGDYGFVNSMGPQVPCCLLICLDDDIVAVEGTGNFALRIGHLDEARRSGILTDDVYFYDLTHWIPKSAWIFHQQTAWKAKAHAAIQQMSGLTPPPVHFP